MATVLPSFNPVAGIQEAFRTPGLLFQQKKQQQQQQQLLQKQQGAQLSDQQGILQYIQQRQAGLNPALPQFQTAQGAAALAGFLGKQEQQQPGFTLSPGQERFTAEGEAVASVEPTPIAEKPKAGALQVAGIDDVSGLAEGTVFQAGPQGNINVISQPGGEGLTAGKKVELAVTQAKEFRADERVKNLNIIERSERGMQAALKQSKTAKSRIASDQALGVLFQKMLDPTSVVRESEFARTPQGAALMSRIEAIAPQLAKGGLKITNEDRQALVDMSQKLLREAKITANQAFSEFQTRSDQIGLNSKIVFGGRKPFDITDNENQATSLESRINDLFPTEQAQPNVGTGPSRAGLLGGQKVRNSVQEARLQELLKKAGQ